MSIVRVRQHVNPLSSRYQAPVEPPDWSTLYADLTQPLLLDIGCARGRFLLQMAEAEPRWNFLGLEIREPLVAQANELRDARSLTNLHYLFCNANPSLGPLLRSLPEGRLQRVTIQFPDPWFKKRHQKRRVVQPEVVEAIAQTLVLGGTVFLQSDVQAVAQEMGDRFLEHPAFERAHASLWLADNPLPVPTERELVTLAKGEPVYRLLLVKRSDPTAKPATERDGIC